MATTLISEESIGLE